MSRFEKEKTMDTWIGEKIGIPSGKELTREVLEAYQLMKLRETVRYAKEKSKFYRELLHEMNPEQIKSFSDIEKLPFTTVLDLKEKGTEMVCVSQNEINRIVTLDTSGSTGNPKRIYFTESDQELTIDFFHNGMKNLVDEGDVVLILLPCQRPGSVGDLLATGLGRLGAESVPYGLLNPQRSDAIELLELMADKGVTSIVGSPTQLLELARISKSLTLSEDKKHLHNKITENMRTLLLSTEFVPDSSCKELTEIWGCRVFEHYGMTEMGLGGAVSCFALEGCHPREADLYFEIIDPNTGKLAEDGEWGEVVFTTLTRKAMPFIRYRTGDISRWLTHSCPCGSVLKRMDKVGDRKEKKKV